MKLQPRSKKIFSIIILLSLSALAFKNILTDRAFEIAKNLDIFATLYKEVNTYYVDEVNPNQMIKIGIEAMLDSLDPYTNYIPEDKIEDYRTMTTGEYGGIGTFIQKINENIYVGDLYKGMPAEEAGLKIGDEILAIDDIFIKEKSLENIHDLLRGQANTEVKLSIKRYGTEGLKTITVKRKKIKINNVSYYGMLNANIGYLQLSDFTVDASKEVKNAVKNLIKEGADKLVLDLRGNPGGLLSEAINISNLFIDKGMEVVRTKGRIDEWNKQYNTLDEPLHTDIPIVVLINGTSASASEIVSGVIQDYDRGILIGQKTYGKGLVQTTRPLSYNAQLKITIAKYYIPSGRCIQAIDYSKRNQNGEAFKHPDSLKIAYKTRNGRVVYDGNGLDPDVSVNPIKLSEITESLIDKHLIFEYANKYAFEHPAIPSAKFSLNDDAYNNFIQWLEKKQYNYTTKIEKTLDTLINQAKKDHYDTAVLSEINNLKKKILHQKEKELFKYKDEIIELLEAEIASRYFFQYGRIEAGFDDDPIILKAIEVLSNTQEYYDLLKKN